MRFYKAKTILTASILVVGFFDFSASAVDDEEGPQIISYTVSPSTSLSIGSKVTITLKMTDPGGSGIRNVQFCISDKFGRQHCADNYAELSNPQFVCPGSNVCDYPFVFSIDQTWANNGYTLPIHLRAFDLKANGTYFYDDGKFENLQSKTYYSGLHALVNLKLLIGAAPTPTPTPTPTAVTTKSAVPTPSAKKLITIKCTKGKLTKKVSGVKPKCPTGYKKA